MEQTTLFIIIVIIIAYAFDFINGFHDAANSIATIVTTGVLTPRQAVLWAAFFNFVAFMFFNLMVAKTIGSGLVDAAVINEKLIFAALVGAIAWNLVTWYFGLPSSSSHALIGGLIGAAVIRGGPSALIWTGCFKVALGILFSPAIGMLFGFGLAYVLNKLLHRMDEQKIGKIFAGFQLASSALLSLTHGGNDAQKTMGIIAVLLFSQAWLHGPFYIPWWVVISCQAMISLGTLFGGWRIARTMGTKITQLNTVRGCAAETAAAIIIYAATEYGIPVSTTHTVTGSIAGVGFVKGLNGSCWPMLRLIFLAWILTIPAAGLISATIIWLI